MLNEKCLYWTCWLCVRIFTACTSCTSVCQIKAACSVLELLVAAFSDEPEGTETHSILEGLV